MRARALVVVVLLLSYGAVGARQPAVRTAAQLPVPATEIATALGINTIDRGHLVLDVVRAMLAMGVAESDVQRRSRMRELLLHPKQTRDETVPLPLDPSIWRDTVLQRQVADNQIITAILTDRNASLLYHGLAGLDDDTLAWLGPDRDTLRLLLSRAGPFAAFGPSLRVRAGRVVVPGGADAEPVWQAIVGADPGRPGAFVRRLFGEPAGRLAWFYDALARLDEPQLRFALGGPAPTQPRIERARALLDVFQTAGEEWRPDLQPFSRRPLDPSLTLALVDVTPDGRLIGPSSRATWEQVFFDDDPGDVTSIPRMLPTSTQTMPVDGVWLTSRVHRVPFEQGRRRLETVLFAQRMFGRASVEDPLLVTTLRGYNAFPALMQSLERAGVTNVTTLAVAADRARALNNVKDNERKDIAIEQFQATLGILERIVRGGSLSRPTAESLIGGLLRVDTTDKGYQGRLAAWIKSELIPRLPEAANETQDAIEDTLVGAMGGVERNTARPRVVEWEGRTYHVSAARAEVLRLRRVRQRQGGLSLSAALEQGDKNVGDAAERALCETLTSILYAASIGDPEGPALKGGNVALRHDLGLSGSAGLRTAWRLPTEGHGSKGWKVTGSLLGLDVALSRLALRRLDATVMPTESKLVSSERQTASLTVALLNPATLSDAARDEIAAAVARGRRRLAGLTGTRDEIAEVARDAGLSPWRREALAWTIAHDRERVESLLSLVELMWLGKPRASASVSLDDWGAAALPLNGCVCLTMPRAQPWESFTGRPAMGLLATRGADVTILVAETLAALELPAEIAPGVVAFAMQEVIDRAQPAHFDDWPEFSRAVSAVTRDQLVDYIAALTADGPLMSIARSGGSAALRQ
jgi:hypothetical protein